MNISLALATHSDAQEMTIIQKLAFERLYELYQDAQSPYLRGEDEFLRWTDNPNVDIYKILSDYVLCGGIAIFKRSNNEFYLARLYISPKFQNRGIATNAIQICEEFYPYATKWTLDFPIDQLANKTCYEKAGYIDTGIRDKKYDKLTLAIYEKVLNL